MKEAADCGSDSCGGIQEWGLPLNGLSLTILVTTLVRAE